MWLSFPSDSSVETPSILPQWISEKAVGHVRSGKIDFIDKTPHDFPVEVESYLKYIKVKIC